MNINNTIFNLWNPHIEAFPGFYYDYCFGLRVKSANNSYYVKMIDNFSNQSDFEGIVNPGKTISSDKKYYVDWRLEVYDKDKKKLLFKDNINLHNKEVTIAFSTKAVGDVFAWFNSIERFQRKYNAKLTVVIDEKYIDVFKKKHNYDIVSEITKKTYAMYVFIPGGFVISLNYINTILEPLQWQSDNVLGLEHSDELPKLDLSGKKPYGKYVCCSFVGSTKCKNWQNPIAIQETVDWLIDNGYNVYIVGAKEDIPKGAIDDTGYKSMQERIDLISGAEFFIGVASGLSWVARACKIPVIVISGFSLPITEWQNEYRVISYKSCYGCYSSGLFSRVFLKNIPLEEKAKLSGCHYQGTDKEFECSKNINSTMVINTIKKVLTKKNQIADMFLL